MSIGMDRGFKTVPILPAEFLDLDNTPVNHDIFGTSEIFREKGTRGMKIALIGNEYYQQFPLISYGGIESSVENTAWGLHRYGGVDFFCIVPRRTRPLVTSYPFEIIETAFSPACRSGARAEVFIAEAISILRELKPDIVWSQSSWSVRPLIASGIPFIATFQDSCGKQDGWLVNHSCAHYRFISQFQFRNWVREDWERKCSWQVYTGLVDEEYDPGDHHDGYFLWVAGLDWGIHRKGLDMFVALARRNPDKRFVAYGTGNPLLGAALKGLGLLLGNFEFRGTLLRGPAHAEAFKNARAFIMPTQIPEALGRTVLESLSKGTPVIGSANGALPEILPSEVGVATNDFHLMNESLSMPFDSAICTEYAGTFHVRHEVGQLLAISAKILGYRTHILHSAPLHKSNSLVH